MQQFMESKGKVFNELSSVQWLADLAFLVYITQQLICLNFAFTRTQQIIYISIGCQSTVASIGKKKWICEKNKPDMLIYCII